MDLIFNELSYSPLAENTYVAEKRFTEILFTLKEAKQRYDFRHIRFPVNNPEIHVTVHETYSEWVYNISNRTLKSLILDLIKPPYADDLEKEELDNFFESEYIIIGSEAPEKESPVGLPVAFIKSVPSISLDSHYFWRNRKIQISKTNQSESENTTFIVYNICLKDDLNSPEIIEWAEKCLPPHIHSKDLLIKFLGYEKFTSNFTNDFMQHFFEWKAKDMESFKYLLLLMKDVELHPFTGGRGKTENLKNRGKEASKQINQLDRLSYSIEKNVVTFIACKGHYDFHD